MQFAMFDRHAYLGEKLPAGFLDAGEGKLRGAEAEHSRG